MIQFLLASAVVTSGAVQPLAVKALDWDGIVVLRKSCYDNLSAERLEVETVRKRALQLRRVEGFSRLSNELLAWRRGEDLTPSGDVLVDYHLYLYLSLAKSYQVSMFFFWKCVNSIDLKSDSPVWLVDTNTKVPLKSLLYGKIEQMASIIAKEYPVIKNMKIDEKIWFIQYYRSKGFSTTDSEINTASVGIMAYGGWHSTLDVYEDPSDSHDRIEKFYEEYYALDTAMLKLPAESSEPPMRS